MSTNVKKNKLTEKVTLLLIFASILTAAYYLPKISSEKIKDTKEKIRAASGGANVIDDNKRVLDCAKKVATNSSLLGVGPSSLKSDCTFQGCGDFFQ